MRSFKKFLFGTLFLVLFMACGFTNTAQDVAVKNTDKYDEAIALINACEKSVADYSLVINGNKAKIDDIVAERVAYYEAVIGNTEAWMGKINEASNNLDEQLSAASGQPTLADLQANGAFPGQMESGLSLYFQSLTQAPPPEISADFASQIVNIKAEAYDTMIYAGTKVNDKCTAYNTWRETTEGEIVDAVAAELGYDLPDHIDLVTGGDGQNTDSFK